MLRSYEWMISSRYLRGARGRGFLSFISVVSVLGLAVGVAVLIVVLSVMNGFARELQTRILSVTAHAELTGLDGNLVHWRRDQAQALKLPGVAAAAPYIEAQALLVHGARTAGTTIRGVLPRDERRAVGLAERIRGGSIDELTDGSYHIILGDALAEQLAAKVGDQIVLVAPRGNATPAGIQPRVRRFLVTGIFHSGMYEYDSGLALVHMRDAARIYEMGDTVTGVRLALTNPFQAPQIVRELALSLGGGYYVSDWTQAHRNFFRSIQTDKSILFVILLLVIAVAAFNVVAALVMVVKDKRADIAILRTLGAGPRNVLAVFSLQGAFIGLTGTLLGAAVGLILSVNLESLVHGLERLLGTHFLDAKVYLMSDLPAYPQADDVLKICAVAFVLCALATLYPAWRAAGTHPAEALRHD
ncbi:MAG TPA: lipoprotein-releasing ABC transporter permease subunit [Steroidobacteraceae bacterium]|jgi:lipoprotein-releasing system permease protein|nr:lipoprotein-releasing ABC transporter permease subunit [Steroidobacteraceae bacterium]